MKKTMLSVFAFFFLFLAFSSVLFSQQWQPCKIGLEKENIYYINANENRITAYSEPDGLFLSTDDGLTWTAINEGLEKYPNENSIPHINSVSYCGNKMFVTTSFFGFYYSTNNGNNWNLYNDSSSSDFSAYPSIINVSDKMIFGGDGIIRISYDCGDTWHLASSGHLLRQFSGFSVNNNKIYAGTLYGMLHLSTDGGASWDTIANLSFPISYIAAKDNYIFLGEYSSGLHISSDDGESWENQLIQNNEEIRISSLIFYNNTLIAGTDFGVFTTYDFGKTWTELNNGLTSLYVRSLAINDNYLFAGTSDGVYKIDLTALSVENSGNNLNNEFTLQIDNISKTAQLNFFQNNEHFKEVMIYDVLGNIVFRNSYQTNQIKIDLNTFTNGVYFVQVKGNNSNSFSKFVLY